jgi:hypothetical protein
LVGQILPGSFAEGLDHLEHGGPASGTEVPGFNTGILVTQVVERDEVAVGEVEDVDVVANGGAILGGVV